MKNKRFQQFLLLFFLLPTTISVYGHSGGHPVRFVSQKGVDDGVCNTAKTPCKSIAYTVNQSSKGEKIHVSEGKYTRYHSRCRFHCSARKFDQGATRREWLALSKGCNAEQVF